MPVHNYEPLRGRVIELRVAAPRLQAARLGDPWVRSVAVYLPEGYDDHRGELPLFVDLAAFTGSGLRRLGWTAFGESVPQRIERLIAQGALGPAVFAFPDCFTALGGNQYVNSSVVGEWESFLVDDMLPCLEGQLKIRRDREGRALYGKSSGGYGALYHGMRRADVWGAIASHSGDVGFDLLYRGEFPRVLQALARHGVAEDPAAAIERFIAGVRAAPKIRGDHFHVLGTLAMAATYDPDPAAPYGVRLPVDPHTCELDAAAWARWLAFDPLTMIDEPACQDNLRSLRGLYIDVGARDQYMIHYGTRALVRRLRAAGIDHVYEEFDDDHSSVDYRLDVSLPYLYAAIAGAPAAAR